MKDVKDPISADLDNQLARERQKTALGPIAAIATQYESKTSNRLFGLLLKFEFETLHVVTCDPWKRNCGGVPRGAFIVLRVDPNSIGIEELEYANRLILARIVDEAPTPVDQDTTRMLFQIHKLGAILHPVSKKDLQWSGLKAKVIGTYYDRAEEGQSAIGFGNDVNTYFAPHCYVAFIPTAEHLEELVNAFVDKERAVPIGELRYTETPSLERRASTVTVKIDPRDLIGELQAAQRTALFGKTRFGKSNGAKIVGQSIFASDLDVGQLFIDPSGEYTYINPQDKTSLFALNNERSVRYALKAREQSPEEQAAGLKPPDPLAINFYQFPDVGFSLVKQLWITVNPGTPPGYIRPILDWDPIPLDQAPLETDYSGYAHYWRTMGLYFGLLLKAGFEPRDRTRAIHVDFPRPVKQQLLSSLQALKRNSTGDFITEQPMSVLPELWREVYALWNSNRTLFPNSSDGSAYFNEVEVAFLRCLGDSTKTGANYFRPFNKYHRSKGSAIFSDIVNHLVAGTSVFLDMAQANELIVGNFTEHICRELVRKQNEIFAERPALQRTVVIYIEEAQKRFRANEKDPNNIYNVLAREGAKYNIAMIYLTQSLSTISPDLTAMTDNLIVTHLDDDRETKELAHKHMFRDLAHDLERIQTKGFVRMATRSHRYALPVQLYKFSREWALELLARKQK
jgi:hypothetical protein